MATIEKSATEIVKIKPDDGSPDAFVHFRSVERNGVVRLVQNMRVGFDVLENKRTGKHEAETSVL